MALDFYVATRSILSELELTSLSPCGFLGFQDNRIFVLIQTEKKSVLSVIQNKKYKKKS